MPVFRPQRLRHLPGGRRHVVDVQDSGPGVAWEWELPVEIQEFRVQSVFGVGRVERR